MGLEDRDVSRFTGYVDYRWYKTLFYRNSFAFRMLGAASTGKDPRLFFLGGPTTLRGYDYLAFEGTKMGMFSVEYRFPLIDALVFGWPGRWGFNNIGGSVFFDAGSIWDEHDPNFFVDNVSGLQFQMARTSSRPGRTQTVNFYRVNERCWFVDLPGYGWAKVPEAIRRAWKPMVDGYLERRRERIALAFLVIDSRHAASELDLSMQAWLEQAQVPYLITATKSDKLKSRERSRSERGLRESYGGLPVESGPFLISAETGDGVRGLWRHLDAALATWWETVGVAGR